MNPECLLMLAMPRSREFPKLREQLASAWKSGDKVLCIDANGLPCTYLSALSVKERSTLPRGLS